MPTKNEIEKSIKELLVRYNAEYALLFGSYARGEQTENSDIDVLVFGGENFKKSNIFEFKETTDQLLAIRKIKDKGFLFSIMYKVDNERIKKIIDIWSSLQLQIKEHSITKENLLNDEFLQWAVTTPLYNIGEQVYKISDDTKKQYPDIIWSIVAGLRHRLVHDYEGINWSIIVEVIFDEMDDFVNSIKQIIE